MLFVPSLKHVKIILCAWDPFYFKILSGENDGHDKVSKSWLSTELCSPMLI